MKKFSLIVATLLFSTFAFGASQQIPKNRKIQQISTYDNVALITFTPSYKFNQGCTHTSKSLLAIEFNTEKGKEMYGAVLAAASQGLTVGFGISGCAGDKNRAYRVDVLYR